MSYGISALFHFYLNWGKYCSLYVVVVNVFVNCCFYVSFVKFLTGCCFDFGMRILMLSGDVKLNPGPATI